jgi:hypothetical protein
MNVWVLWVIYILLVVIFWILFAYLSFNGRRMHPALAGFIASLIGVLFFFFAAPYIYYDAVATEGDSFSYGFLAFIVYALPIVTLAWYLIAGGLRTEHITAWAVKSRATAVASECAPNVSNVSNDGFFSFFGDNNNTTTNKSPENYHYKGVSECSLETGECHPLKEKLHIGNEKLVRYYV